MPRLLLLCLQDRDIGLRGGDLRVAGGHHRHRLAAVARGGVKLCARGYRGLLQRRQAGERRFGQRQVGGGRFALRSRAVHLRHSRDWLVRLGDGTDESHIRAQVALDHLFPYTQEFWAHSAVESAAVAAGIGVDLATLQADWDAIVDAALAEATLQRPALGGYVPEGKNGIHSEHLGFLLAEMQSLARAHPNGSW
jgi:hypothetical protein